MESVDGATRVGTTLLFGDIAPGARVEAAVRLRVARLVARGTAVTVNGRIEAVGLLPLALAPVTIPTVAEPRFDQGASLRTQPSETVDAGEPLYVRLAVRNTGDGAASRLVVRGQLPQHTAYYPGSTAVNDVPLLDVDGVSVLWSKAGLVLEDVDPGVEVVLRFGTIVNTPLAAGTLVDGHVDLSWDGGGSFSVSSPAVRVRSTPAFAVRASGLPFSVSGIAPRTSDVLHDIAEQRRAAQALPPSAVAALPPATTIERPPAAEPQAPPGPPQAPPPDRATFRYDEEAIEARFTPSPPAPPPRIPEPVPLPPAPQAEPPAAETHVAEPAPPTPAPAAPQAAAPPPAAPAEPPPSLATLSGSAPVPAPSPSSPSPRPPSVSEPAARFVPEPPGEPEPRCPTPTSQPAPSRRSRAAEHVDEVALAQAPAAHPSAPPVDPLAAPIPVAPERPPPSPKRRPSRRSTARRAEAPAAVSEAPPGVAEAPPAVAEAPPGVAEAPPAVAEDRPRRSAARRRGSTALPRRCSGRPRRSGSRRSDRRGRARRGARRCGAGSVAAPEPEPVLPEPPRAAVAPEPVPRFRPPRLPRKP